jgi:P pilus assembly chaperone PapD
MNWMLRRLALLLFVIGAAPHARAAGLQVVPILVELSRAEPRAFVLVRNTSDASVRLESTVSAWDETRDGKMRLAPAPEFTVFPPLMELPAHGERKIRVSTTATFGEREQPYRLFIQELPPAEKPKEKAAIHFLTRLGIPVFLSPPRVDLKAEVREASAAGGQLKWVIKNTGNTRLSPTQLQLEGLLADGKKAWSESVDAWYVLAGGERAFEHKLPSESCSKVTAIVIEVPVGDEKVRARVETPGGACGP